MRLAEISADWRFAILLKKKRITKARPVYPFPIAEQIPTGVKRHPIWQVLRQAPDAILHTRVPECPGLPPLPPAA